LLHDDTHHHDEERVGKVDTGQARQGARVERIELDISKANAGRSGRRR